MKHDTIKYRLHTYSKNEREFQSDMTRGGGLFHKYYDSLKNVSVFVQLEYIRLFVKNDLRTLLET